MSSVDLTVKLLLSFDAAVSWPESDRVLQEALSFFEAHFPGDRFSITMQPPSQDGLYTYTRDDSIKELAQGSLQLTTLADIQKRFKGGRTIYVPDLNAVKRLKPMEKALKNAGYRCFVSVPLLSKELVSGSINIGGRTPIAFDNSVIEALEALAPRLTLALHHAKVHDELQEKQQALTLSEKDHRDLIDQAGDAILRGDADGTIIQMNKAVTSLFGYTPKELLGKHIMDIFSPAVLREKPLRFDLIEQGKTVITERKVVHKDGRYIPVEMNTRKLDSGHFVSIIRDLSERFKVEAQVQTTEQRLFDAEKMARLGTWEYDFEQDLFQPSENFCQLLGVKPGKLKGSLAKYVSFIHSEDQKSFELALADTSLHASTLNITHRVAVKEGEVWLTLKGRLDKRNKDAQSKIIGSAQDVSDLYSTQKALRASEAHAQQQFTLLRSIADNTPNMVWAEDAHGVFTFVNKHFSGAFLNMATTTEPVGSTLKEVIKKKDIDSSSDSLLGAILEFQQRNQGQDNDTTEVDLTGMHNGKTTHLRLTQVLLRDFKRKVVGVIYSGFDITSQVLQTQELENSRHQTQALLDAIPAPVYAKDISGHYVLLNDAYLSFFNREASEMIGKTVAESWPDELAKQFLEDDRLLLEENKRQSYPASLKNGGGETREVMVHKARYFDTQGQVAGLIGTLWDYTELQAAEERYHTLFDNSPVPVVVHNTQHVIAANQAALSFFGVAEPGDYYDRPVSSFVHPDYHEISAQRAQQVLEDNKSNDIMEQKFITLNGEVRDVAVAAAPVILERSAAVLTSFIDITEEKRNRELISKSQKSYRTLIDLTPNPVFVHAKGKIIYANQAALEFGGRLRLEDYEGVNLFEFVHPDTRELSRANLEELLRTGKPMPPGEQRYVRGDGTVRNVESRAVPVNYEGQDAVLVSFVDNTEGITARQELQESRKQLEMVTDHVTHYILLLDYNFNILFGNRSAASFFNMDKMALVGLQADQVIEAPAIEIARELLSKTSPNEPGSFTYVYTRKSGRQSQYHTTLIPIEGRDGHSLAFLAQIEDITEREAARQELADNRELLELVIDTIPALIAYTDSSEKLLFVNKSYADWHKKSKTDLVGSSLTDVMGSKAYAEMSPFLQGVLNGDQQLFSRVHPRKNAIPFVYEGSYIPHFDRQKQVKAFVTVLRDVSLQHRAEEVQSALRELAHALTEPMNIFEVGERSALAVRSVFKSDALALELFDHPNQVNRGIYTEDTFKDGGEPKSIPSKDLPFKGLDPTLYSPDYPAECVNRTEADLEDTLKTITFGDARLSRSFLNVPIRWEGSAIGILSVQSYTPNKYSDNDLPLLQTFGDQIGIALKRSLQDAEILEQRSALEKEEQKYRSIIDNAGDAVFVISMDGGILNVNEHCCEVLGYSVSQLLDMNYRKVDPLFFDLLDDQAFDGLSKFGKTINMLSEHQRRDDSRFPVENRVSLTEIDGESCILIFARDITERRRAELRERSLKDLAHRLNESKDMRAAGRQAAQAIRSFFGSDAFAIEYYDFDARIIVGVYSEDSLEPGDDPAEVEPSDTNMDDVRADFFKKNAAAHVRNRTPEDLKKITKSRPFGSPRLSHSLLFAPIVWEEKIIGILTVQSYTDNKYSEADLGDLQLFADQIGGALMRARANADLMIQTNALLKSEQKLTGLLNEKDVLLKEVYHRTKNNMQVIVGLLEMQGYKTQNKETITALKEMTDRISSMSMVHDLLYRSKSLADIRLDTYLNKLVGRLVTAYQSPYKVIDTHIEADSMAINIQFAVPLGLVINEMVTNSLKYAFKGRPSGKIWVEARAWNEEGLELTIRDNGVGLGKDFKVSRSDTLGLRIIRDIIELQLMGSFSMEKKNGLAYRLQLPNINLDAKEV